MAALLMESKPDLNAQDQYGYTALHLAVAMDDKDLAVTLLANKADIHAKNDKGETPLDIAISRHITNMTMLLRQYEGGH